MTEHHVWTILIIATAGSTALVILAGMALSRRRSWPYVLVTIAIGMLVLRSILGLTSLTNLISLQTHHFLEHTLDVIVIIVLFLAVYLARTVKPDLPIDDQQPPRNN